MTRLCEITLAIEIQQFLQSISVYLDVLVSLKGPAQQQSRAYMC